MICSLFEVLGGTELLVVQPGEDVGDDVQASEFVVEREVEFLES